MAAALWAARAHADGVKSRTAAIRIVAIGDSLTAGLGLREQDTFTVRLDAALRARGHNVTVVNAGVSGDTTAGGRTRLAWTIAGSGAEKTDAVILELGANDGLRGLDPGATFANLDDILTRLGRRKIPVLLTGMLAPPNLGRDYARQFREIYIRLAQKHDVVFYPFFLAGVAADPKLNQNDAKHPNADGVKVIVRRILPAVEKLLKRVSGRGES
ncbi:arylesterase [Varunaivibrio sulfuroxidans]|uniref:arylesterase n=1 Tax=Varunaivibrio sulfuroxidans TaxID=1773489 RepID=UPI0010526277|nr:arylesterase [Varunaivibrio sulfuroxidans]WES29895.1 arylesterase [Varunaivibrio sulfuroxidans]